MKNNEPYEIVQKLHYLPVTGSDFFGRKLEIQKGYDFLKEYHKVLLVSEKRTGKTSSYKQLLDCFQQKNGAYELFLVNASDSFDNFLYNHFDTINYNLKKNYKPETSSNEIVTYIENNCAHQNIIFVYDEIVFKNFSSIEQERFQQFIYPEAYHQSDLNFYLMITADYAFLTPQINEFFKHCFIHIPPLSRDAMEEMLKETYKKELHFSKNVMDLFWQFSGGAPKLAKMLCMELITNINIGIEDSFSVSPTHAQYEPYLPISITQNEVIDTICSVIADKSDFHTDFDVLKINHFSEEEYKLLKNDRVSLDNPIAQRMSDRCFFEKNIDHYAPRMKAYHWALTNKSATYRSITTLLTEKIQSTRSSLRKTDLIVDEKGLIIRNNRVPCSKQERALLEILLQASGQVVSYSDLYHQISFSAHDSQEIELKIMVNSLQRRLDENLNDLEWLLEAEELGYFLRLEDE